MSQTYHVSAATGKDYNEGSEKAPFKTINRAASLAMPGDTVVVHQGTYREWVDPLNSGIDEQRRITYMVAPGEHAVIKGSERITTWQHEEGNVWRVALPNTLFGSFNPYRERLEGDWLISPDHTATPHEEDGVLMDFPLHLGDVYLNGKSLYEAGRYQDIVCPKMRLTGVNPPWTRQPEPLLHPEDSVYQWYCEVDDEAEQTLIYANFQGANPNEELVEINVRRSCFFPRRTGRNYIIYNIAVKHEFFGYEIAGIKLHAAIDVDIHHNNIHNSALGTWLDWQAQGAHVHHNLFYGNDRDLMIEVTHGPYLVDHNIFGSEYNFDNVAQGGAYVHNLCAGIMCRIDCRDRSTPYHFPHSAELAGCTIVYGGDDRLYNNIFIGGSKAVAEDASCGTAGYNGHPHGWDAYQAIIRSKGNSDHEKFQETPQAVYIAGNAYLNGAPAYDEERDLFCSAEPCQFRIEEAADGTYLCIDVPAGVMDVPTSVVSTLTLGSTRITEGLFDDRDGQPYVLDTDYLGQQRPSAPKPGPIEQIQAGSNRIRVW